MTDKDKLYYGVDKPPKGKKYASMTEAIKAKQVRRWGLYKVDPMLLAAKFESIGPTAKQLKDEYLKLNGQYSMLEKKYRNTYDEKQKQLLYSDLKNIHTKIKETMEKMKEAEKKGYNNAERIILDPTKDKVAVIAKKQEQLKKKQEALKKKTTVKKKPVIKKKVTKKQMTKKK